ncbi:MAG TPA: hypothetical protein VGR30_14505 [Candidatus Binatia bacterium]|jgi:hypothetical protein|nr:hypothetical protein [Candidatus Binatia bacterium]
MNIEQSKKNIGKDFPFDPPPQSLTWTPSAVPIPDEFNRWRFEMVYRKQHIVRFSHSLGYLVAVPFEHIVGHERDGRYKLKKQLIINGPRIDLVPNV